jgi:type I restriction enzyme S subunit
MDAQTFLDNFTTIAGAPGGVQRLRDLVLELGFRGRLTTADSGTNVEPSPGPASTPSSPKSAPFEIPRHWVWHRLDEIADYNKRPKVSPNTLPDSAWSLDLADIEKTTSTLIRRVRASERHSKSAKCAFERGDVLYGKLRPYLDKVLVADSNGYCTTEIVPIVPKAGIISQYLRWSLKRPDFRRSVESLSYGMKMPRLGTKDALASLHPVPPLAEQERIVAKVDELMGLCDDLEARQERRRSAITHFRRSALHALVEAETPDDLRHAWERVSTNWAALTGPTRLADLRHTILQLAIRGRLVPQLALEPPTNETHPTSAPVDRAKLWELPNLSAAPSTWSTHPMADLGRWGSGGTPAKGHLEYYGGEIPWVVIGDLNDDVVRDTQARITEAGLAGSAAKWIPTGSVLIAMYGASIGKTGVTGIDCTSNQAIAHCVPNPAVITTDYLFLLARTLKSALIQAGKGAAQPNISQQVLKHLVVPVPPLAEQEQIVERVEQLVQLCDQLETVLAAKAAVRNRASRVLAQA